jgi:molybdate transport system permease protein
MDDNGRLIMKNWFSFVLLAAMGIGISIVSSLIYAQLQYAGGSTVIAALKDKDVLTAIWLSFYVSISAALLASFISIPLGYALSRWKFRAKFLVEGILVIPILMSPMALGVSLLLVFRTSTGQFIEDNIMRFVFETPGMILAQFIVAMSLETLIARSVFDNVDIRLEQVARFLGSTPFQTFRYITLPLARNGLFTALILGWARAIGDFGATSMIAGAVKGKTETMPVSIYLNMASVSLDRAVSLSIVLTLFTVLALTLAYLLSPKENEI